MLNPHLNTSLFLEFFTLSGITCIVYYNELNASFFRFPSKYYASYSTKGSSSPYYGYKITADCKLDGLTSV